MLKMRMRFPKGWIVYLKKYMNRPASDFDEYEKLFQKMRTQMPAFTAYGNFDRIELVPINNFADYREKFSTAYDWLGKRQPIMLYAIGTEEETRRFGYAQPSPSDTAPEQGKTQLQVRTRTGDLCEGRFIIHTSLHLSGSAKASIKEYPLYLKLIRDKIAELVDIYRAAKTQKNEILECEVFGAFNSAEVSILWAADQYVDVLFLMEQIRYLNFHYEDQPSEKNRPICYSTYSVIAINSQYQNWSECKDLKGEVFLQVESALRLEPNSRTLTFMEQCTGQLQVENEIDIYSCAGEYDFIEKLPIKSLHPLFPVQLSQKRLNQDDYYSNLKGTFSIHNRDFAQHIHQTTTRLAFTHQDIDEECRGLDWNKLLTIQVGRGDYDLLTYSTQTLKVQDQIEPESGRIYKKFKELQKELSKIVPYSGLQKTLNLLYSDYAEIICTSIDHLWIKDYDQQFETTLDLIESTIQYYNKRFTEKASSQLSDWVLTQIEDLSDILKQQVAHIVESSKLFFEAPNSNMGYTAQFDLILHAYYGFVKEFISNAYLREKQSWQHTIVPVINFTNTPVIKSSMIYDAAQKRESNRLVSLQLPYDAWANPIYYLPYLVHEVYHYVSPAKREARNACFIVITISELCIKFLDEALQLFQEDAVALRQLLVEAYRYEIYHAVISNQAVYYRKLQELLPSEIVAQNSGDLPAYLIPNAMRKWFRTGGDQAVMSTVKLIAQSHLGKGSELVGEEFANRDYIVEQVEAFNRALCCRFELRTEALKRTDPEAHAPNAIIDQLREILPDIAMIRQTSMQLVHYLVQFVALQNRLLKRPSDLEKLRVIGWRLGPIIDHFSALEGRKNDGRVYLKNNEARFVQIYQHMMCTMNLNAGKSQRDQFRSEAAEWFKVIEKLYEHYLLNGTIYRSEFFQLVNALDASESTEPRLPFCAIYDRYWSILEGSDTNMDDLLFKLNLELIHMAQNQKSLREISELNRNAGCESMAAQEATTSEDQERRLPPLLADSGSISNDHYVSYLADPDDFLPKIVAMSEKLQESHRSIFNKECGENGLWYRGASNENYHIVPSLFVNFFSARYGVLDVNEEKCRKTPAQVLQYIYEHFRFKADGTPEIISQPSYQKSDYLALMQHYQQHTNFLDWSEDAFVALYFALEASFRGTESNSACNAAIYVFDPEAYNAARRKMIAFYSNYELEKTVGSSYYNAVNRTISPNYELVPNVSVPVNANVFSIFLEPLECLPLEQKSFRSSKPGDIKLPELPQEICKLPIALFTSRLNPRIKAQSGQFVAFNPHTRPVITDAMLKAEKGSADFTHGFDYISLDMIQRFYLEDFSKVCKGPAPQPFLRKLIIQGKDKAIIARQLREIGVKTINYYPELSNAQYEWIKP